MSNVCHDSASTLRLRKSCRRPDASPSLYKVNMPINPILPRAANLILYVDFGVIGVLRVDIAAALPPSLARLSIMIDPERRFNFADPQGESNDD